MTETTLTKVEAAQSEVAPKPRSPRLVWTFILLGIVTVILAVAVLLWKLPAAPGTHGFRVAIDMRLTTVGTILVVACCQAVATVLFHTVTGNRILTPSIMGFEAIYVVMQTGLVFVFGGAMLAASDGLLKVALQTLLMVGTTTLLFTWLFGSRRGNLHVMLLVGVVLGVGLGSLSAFMQRMLTPSDFDVLSARLFGNISNSNVQYLPWAAVIVLIVLAIVWTKRRQLDVLALGEPVATNLGLNYKRQMVGILILISILISVSTTLVGPMSFFGFIVATLTYQILTSAKHKHVLPFAVLMGMATLLGAYFLMRHVFYAAGVLSIIIEFVGGLFFLFFLLRKGVL